MRQLLISRLTFVWFGLVAATLLSWQFGHGVGFSDSHHAGVAIIAVSFIKVRFVLLDFMEVRHAPLPMRIGGEIWAATVCAVLIGLYWIGTNAA